ncbi:hypothetical protein E1B28_013793 [Marasmius oreades]|uniref:Uncharacterized protein n=1 Tax=Marasmius oreades TaxID=181124 RepID=A0A9P7RQJ0_9AGAR|nr:uncharacterized protein E1B28_013793 [Marasmius oreades]KAG7087855.1 hypothetical protein E1B28_013793 [Marasmius oreades]
MSSWRSKFNVEEVERLLNEFGTSATLCSILDKTFTDPVWGPRESYVDDDEVTREQEIREHVLSLNIPDLIIVGEPPMLLHRLGTFPSDKVLKSHLDSVFGENHTFLLNTSGTGKTRILFEGLCQNWGLYLTSRVDSSELGWRDLQTALHFRGEITGQKGFTRYFFDETSSEDDQQSPSDREVNSNTTEANFNLNLALAQRFLSALLLSHLLLFKQYLETATARGYQSAFHKKTWLKVQLHFYEMEIPYRDITEALLSSLPEDNDIDCAISDTISEIFDMPDVTGPMYVALDEANFASHQLEDCFRDREGRRFSALKAVLETWKRHLKPPKFVLVVAGTEIPRADFAGDEWFDWVWTSNTGAFDDKETQRQYAVSLLPPDLPSSPTGQRLLERIWKWTRGRHRCTASLLSVLLEERFVLPHVHLNCYIHCLSDGYQPKDLEEEDKGSLGAFRSEPSFDTVNFDVLASNRRLASCLHATLMSILLQSTERVYFSGEDVALVNHTFGRFIDTQCDCIVIDEPFLLAGAAMWFCDEDHSLVEFRYFKEKILEPGISPQHAAGFAALCLAAAFDSEEGRPLGEVFNFPNVPKKLKGLNKVEGSIVTCRVSRKKAKDTVLRFSEDPCQKIVSWCHSARDAIGWMKDPATPFCIYAPENETATLIFVVKTATGERFWVFLRVLIPSHDDTESLARAQDLALSSHPDRVFNDAISPSETTKVLESLPDLSSHIGQSGVLTVVVSFTEDLDLSKISTGKASGTSTLNLTTIASSTKAYARNKMVMKSIVDAIVTNAVANDAPPRPPERTGAAAQPAPESKPVSKNEPKPGASRVTKRKVEVEVSVQVEEEGSSEDERKSKKKGKGKEKAEGPAPSSSKSNKKPQTSAGGTRRSARLAAKACNV